MSNDAYMKRVMGEVGEVLKKYDPVVIIDTIAKNNRGVQTLSKIEQELLGAVLGSMLHEAYCNSRKLEKPNEDGLANNPRIKVLTEEIDSDFVKKVVDGTIPQSKTLYIEDGKVHMDIANTKFANLSPHWQKDNFMAGCAATRSVVTLWDGLVHDNAAVREFATVAIANAIHEAWIARGNIYYDKQGDQVYTNESLATAYINLPQDEKDKDLVHYKMAFDMISTLNERMHQKQEADKKREEQVGASAQGETEPKPAQPGEE